MIGWFLDAPAPLAESRPEVDLTRTAVAVRSATGIEAFVCSSTSPVRNARTRWG